LSTRTEPTGNETYEIDYFDVAGVRHSTFDSTKRTTFVIHGFGNDNTTEWLYEMKDELLVKVIVLIVNMSLGLKRK